VLNQSAVNEVADYNGSDRRLRKIGDDANVNRSIFAPIIVNEDRAAMAVDLARPVAHAHTHRESFVANVPVWLSANPAGPAPIDAAEDV
jgi:hypothetical protein